MRGPLVCARALCGPCAVRLCGVCSCCVCSCCALSRCGRVELACLCTGAIDPTVPTQASLEPRRPGVGSIASRLSHRALPIAFSQALRDRRRSRYIFSLHMHAFCLCRCITRWGPRCHARSSALCVWVVPATAPVSLLCARVLRVRAARARALLLETACVIRSCVRVRCVALAPCARVLCARAVCARAVRYPAMWARGVGMSVYRRDRPDGANASIDRDQTARSWID